MHEATVPLYAATSLLGINEVWVCCSRDGLMGYVLHIAIHHVLTCCVPVACALHDITHSSEQLLIPFLPV